MKQLLNDSKALLRSAIPYVRASDVYVTEDIRMVRNSGSYPAIGLKDGGISYGTEASDQGDTTIRLTAVAYVHLTRQEAGIMGAAGSKGVLDVAKDIAAALGDETFSERFDTVRLTDQGGSEVLLLDDKAISMVPLSFEFVIYA